MTNPDNVGGLLPCPFCGGEAELVGGEQDEFCHWHVQCTVCGAISGESLSTSTPDRDFASESWNRRELCRAAPAGGECQHEWQPDADVMNARYCPKCDVTQTIPRKQAKDSAPAGSGEVDGLADTLVRMADNAYCDYIRKMQRPECLGWEEKVRRGSFDSENLRAHVGAGELLGRHRALHEAAALLRKLQQGAEC